VGVLRGLGRSDEAEVPARKALAIRESAFGTESKEAGSAYHCLAEVLTDMQRYRTFWKESMSHSRHCCACHCVVLSCRSCGFRVISQPICRYEEAEEACRNAVEIWEEKSGPATSVTCSSLELLAKIMRSTDRLGTPPSESLPPWAHSMAVTRLAKLPYPSALTEVVLQMRRSRCCGAACSSVRDARQ